LRVVRWRCRPKKINEIAGSDIGIPRSYTLHYLDRSSELLNGGHGGDVETEAVHGLDNMIM